MLLYQEFTHAEVKELRRQECIFYFLNHAAKLQGAFAYAKNGMRLRVF